ncbi:MAG: Uma2 family endonuclease [Anaerolineae bacterium]|nr:Uma2 family endonuclease [Anaerolineae bacterium]
MVEETLAADTQEHTPQATMSVDEFWAQYADERFELVAGSPQEMTPTGYTHGVVSANVCHYVRVFVKAHDLGVVLSGESGFYLKPGFMRAADAAFITKARLSQVTEPAKYVPFAPDLAVEVVSPYDRARDIANKVDEYLAAGARLVWVVYPEDERVVIYRPGGQSQTLGIDGVVSGEDVLPGFSVSVCDLLEI